MFLCMHQNVPELMLTNVLNALWERLTCLTNNFKQTLLTRSKRVHHTLTVRQLTSEERRKDEVLDLAKIVADFCTNACSDNVHNALLTRLTHSSSTSVSSVLHVCSSRVNSSHYKNVRGTQNTWSASHLTLEERKKVEIGLCHFFADFWQTLAMRRP